MKLIIDQEKIAEKILTEEAKSVVEEAAIGVAANGNNRNFSTIGFSFIDNISPSVLIKH